MGLRPCQDLGLARDAVRSGLFPLYEVENGKLNFTYDSKERVPIREYTSLQRRFRHLDDSEIDKLQEEIEERWSNLVSISQATI